MMKFLLVGLVLLAGCESESAESAAVGNPEVPLNVRILEIARTDLEEHLVVTGPVRAVHATDVSTEESGVVRRIPREKGELVRKGQILVELDRALLEAEKKAAEATYTLHRYNEERMLQLLDANSISKEEALVAHTEMEQAKQAAEIARVRYERAAIKAPFDGVLVDRFVEEGQLVTAGSVVTRIVSPFVLKLEGWVTEREVRRVRPGAPALVSVEGYGELVSARVHWVSVEASRTTGKFAIEIRIDNPDLDLRPGVVGRASVLIDVHQNVVAVPRDALVETPQGSAVYVVDGDRARSELVTLGPDQGLMVVLRDGLAEGQTLVVRGQRDLSPGALVAVQERAQSRDGSIATDPPEVRERVLPWTDHVGVVEKLETP